MESICSRCGGLALNNQYYCASCMEELDSTEIKINSSGTANSDFKKSVKFFFIIYALCVVLSLINGLGDFSDITSISDCLRELFKILLVSFMAYFLGCYIPYIILKFIGSLFSGFKWSYGGGFELIPILILIYFYFTSAVNLGLL